MTGTAVSDGGLLLLDGRPVCPRCCEDLGSPFCCPTPSGPGAALFVAWDAEDYRDMRAELRDAPTVRVPVGAR